MKHDDMPPMPSVTHPPLAFYIQKAIDAHERARMAENDLASAMTHLRRAMLREQSK